MNPNTTVFKTSCAACKEYLFCGSKLDYVCRKKSQNAADFLQIWYLNTRCPWGKNTVSKHLEKRHLAHVPAIKRIHIFHG